MGTSLLLGLGRGIPVPKHLSGEDDVEGESSDESVQNELVVDFLESGEDARQGTGEIVEDLVD